LDAEKVERDEDKIAVTHYAATFWHKARVLICNSCSIVLLIFIFFL
jgi:hypothetical protein